MEFFTEYYYIGATRRGHGHGPDKTTQLLTCNQFISLQLKVTVVLKFLCDLPELTEINT